MSIEPSHRPIWPEAEIIAEPVPTKDASEPRLLVRRRKSQLVSPGGADVVYCAGPPAISLFTGAGGFDIGLEQAGFVTMVQHELDEHACATLLANRPRYFTHAALIQGDIFQTPTSTILDAAGLSVGEAYMLTGGPPCQGFSTSGKRRPRDERNDLVFEFIRVANEARPHFFLFENVPGFQTLNKGEYFEAFLEEAYSSYYELVYGLLECSDYGVSQYRTRFICAGTRRDLWESKRLLASLPKPQCFAQPDLNRIRVLEAGPLFANELNRYTRAPGIRYFPDRPVLRTPAPNHGMTRSLTFLKFYDQLTQEEPDRLVYESAEEMAT